MFKTGDVIAFSGKGLVSRVIQLFTLSKYSHIGIVYDPKTIVESTSLRGFRGVIKHPIAELADYNGGMYHLKLIHNLYEDIDDDVFKISLDKYVGLKYDTRQAILAGLDWFWRFKTKYDNKKIFCSEYLADVYRYNGIISKWINPSEVTPADVVKWPVWESNKKFTIKDGVLKYDGS